MSFFISILIVSVILECHTTEADGTGDCKTINGPQKGKPCIFPFKFLKNRQTYNECTLAGGKQDHHEYWCSTKLDKDGYHMTNQWAECSVGCPGVPDNYTGEVQTSCSTMTGHDCKFPTNIDGVNYYGCLNTLGDGEYYCPVKTAKGRIVRRKCSAECPKDHLMTSEDLSFEEIVQSLLKQQSVHTYIERAKVVNKKGACSKLIVAKFKQVDEAKMPENVKKQKNYKETLKEACKNADRCKNIDVIQCTKPTYMITARFSKLKGESGHEFPPTADCKIECPEIPDED